MNGPTGQRLGLASIPNDNVTLRAMRRTLALELAYRPGGLLATKIHLKHISVATTEGYSSRPSGAQGELLAEVNKHQATHNLDLVLTEFRNYQQGIMPAGPGARELTEFFASVDAQGSDRVDRGESRCVERVVTPVGTSGRDGCRAAGGDNVYGRGTDS